MRSSGPAGVVVTRMDEIDGLADDMD